VTDTLNLSSLTVSTIEFSLDGGGTWFSAGSNGVTLNTTSGLVTWTNTSTLAAADNTSLQISADVIAGATTLANAATVEGDEFDDFTGNDSASVTPKVVDLSMAKTASYDTNTDAVTYTLTVTNTETSGSGLDSTGFTVTDTLNLSSLTVSTIEFSLDGGEWFRAGSDGVTLNTTSGLVTWTNSSTLAAAGNTSLQIRADVIAGATTLANTATVDGDDFDDDTDNDSDTVTPKVVDLDMNKTATFDTDTGKVTYQLEVVNTSAVASSGFTVTDTLPSGLSGLTYSTNGTDFYSAEDLLTQTSVTVTLSQEGVLTWDGGALAANTPTSLYVRATVDAGTTTLANTATVDGDDFDDDTDNDNSTASPAISDLKIEKSVNDQTPNLNG
jgi:uncharacterized repeat protein (TIGR01451 family)